MHKRKRSRMAFRPCLSQAFLEDRLVLNGGVDVSPAIQAIATHAAMIGAAAIPAALVSPSTASSAVSSAVSSANQAPVAALPSQSSLAESPQALPTSFDSSLQNSTGNVENLYDIPATIAINLPTGQLPGIAGTPNSAIGYWGYTDGFGNGFYDFVSETESDPDYFNSLNPGFSMLKDSFTSGFSFPQLTQPTQGPSTGTGTGGLGTGTGDLGGPGMGIGGLGAGHLRFGGTGKGGTGLGGKVSGGFGSEPPAPVTPPEPRRGGPGTAATGPGGPGTAATGRGGPDTAATGPGTAATGPGGPGTAATGSGGPGTPATGRGGPGTPATGSGGPGTPATGPGTPATCPRGPGTGATGNGDPATGPTGNGGEGPPRPETGGP